MSTRYDYEIVRNVEDAANVREAIRYSVLNYMHDQLGWTVEACERRVDLEEKRVIPINLLENMESRGWKLRGSRVLDVGAGQGGAVLELLARGADAHGVEPGPEFLRIARMRLAEAGHDVSRVTEAPGEALPFPDNSFDYVISLQVLEHVRDPLGILNEIFRVLKPGGECHVRCENYLSFREQHYRVPWLPMLPKWLGGMYLNLIGRKPDFLRNYVFYTTYPQIWRLSGAVGFENLTYQPITDRMKDPTELGRGWSRRVARAIRWLPREVGETLTRGVLHARALFKVGVRLHLRKPAEPCP